MHRGNKILFFIVGAIILIHTLVPHCHHGESTNYEVHKKNSDNIKLFAFLKNVFHYSTSGVLKNAEEIKHQVKVLNIRTIKIAFTDIKVIGSDLPEYITNANEIPTLIKLRNIVIQFCKGLRSPPIIWV
ncbi:MAG: hypothetical protein ACM3PT_13805 [Deltaproteobacteria bacterium]